MLLGQVFDRFIRQRPTGVMVRGLLEHVLQPQPLDELFDELAHRQYTRELLFSQVVDLMGLVVCGIYRSPHAAYQNSRDRFSVSLASVYNKINRMEPAIAATLVRRTAERLAAVIGRLGGTLPALLPGYRVKILDGNCLAATEHRIHELRFTNAGPLPGKSLVVLDPALMMAIDVFPCEDGHAQERSLLAAVLPTVQAKDLWIEDRNFCTTAFVFGVARRQGCFLVREHQTNVPWEPVTELARVGDSEGASVWEQSVRVTDPQTGESVTVRRIEVRLAQPTRDGDRVISLLTNLPVEAADAVQVAALYRQRWSIEGLFQVLTETLASEQPRLGYPRAALFGFCVALVAYNVLAVIQAALRAEHGSAKVEDTSWYYLAAEISRVYDGMMVAIPAEEWVIFREMSVATLAKVLKQLAKQVNLSAYRRHRRGPKKPPPPRTSHKEEPHVATAKLLRGRNKNKEPS
jgi:Transposase DDE domain